MNPSTRKLAFAATIAMLSLPIAGYAEPATPNFDSTYGVVTDRNMFLRDRHKPVVYKPRPRPTVDNSRQAIERSNVLRGVAIEDDELHAYVENTRTNSLTRLNVGDPIAGGHVTDIAIDAIAYVADGRQAWVEVGENLAGGREAAPPPAEPTTLPAATAGNPTPLPPGGGTLEERMKARRALQGRH